MNKSCFFFKLIHTHKEHTPSEAKMLHRRVLWKHSPAAQQTLQKYEIQAYLVKLRWQVFNYTPSAYLVCNIYPPHEERQSSPKCSAKTWKCQQLLSFN